MQALMQNLYHTKLFVLILLLTCSLNVQDTYAGTGSSRMAKPLTPGTEPIMLPVPIRHVDEPPAGAGAGAPMTQVATPTLPKNLHMALEHNIDINALPAEIQTKFTAEVLVKKFKQNHLYTAVKKGYKPNVAWLLEHGASVLIHDAVPGHDALHISKDPEVTKLLIAHGADITRRNQVCVIGCFASCPATLRSFHTGRTALEISQLRLAQAQDYPCDKRRHHPAYQADTLSANIAVLKHAKNMYPLRAEKVWWIGAVCQKQAPTYKPAHADLD